MSKIPWYKTPPIVALIAIIISLLLHVYYPIQKILFFPFNLTGILFIVLGFLLSVWGSVAFSRCHVEVYPGSKSKEIVQDGPYRFTRNPMYLGATIVCLGVSFIFGSLSSFIGPIIFLIFANFFMIPYEEKIMEKQFGKKYLDFKRKVRRWI